ncbi:XkdX family protein [Paenibacillus sp. FSL R5-0527]|nr:polysulfide reductase [Paenibacillus macerans]
MKFWTLAFTMKWVTAEALRGAVKTEQNPFGEITPEEYKEITKIDFEQQE